MSCGPSFSMTFPAVEIPLARFIYYSHRSRSLLRVTVSHARRMVDIRTSCYTDFVAPILFTSQGLLKGGDQCICLKKKKTGFQFTSEKILSAIFSPGSHRHFKQTRTRPALQQDPTFLNGEDERLVQVGK